MSEAFLRPFRANSDRCSTLLGWLLFAGALAALAAILPPGLPSAGLSTAFLAFGLIGIWRWSWGALHFVRSILYTGLVFPRIRRRAEHARPPSALYVVVTSYRLPQPLNAAVYGRLFDEVADMGVPAVVVACVTDHADTLVISRAFARRRMPEGSKVEFLAQANRGKRHAMAAALDVVAAERPPARAQVVLMDGDTLLGEGSLARTCAVLAAEPGVGAVTTDNLPLVAGGAFTREWYRLRMAQRANLMGSMSLSGRILVLTGRFSAFRADLATSEGFIRAVGRDAIDHPRLGRIPMLTGDDKSTWFETLRAGWRMLYVPDVAVYPVEELPRGGFLEASCALMARWYGNMVRNNGRALALGPRRCGWFFWLALLDQRLSMWTSLLGPAVVLVLALTRHWSVLVVYAIWVLASRMVFAALLGLRSGRFHPFFVAGLYYNQIVGSLIKIVAVHHPDRQRWTRQASASAARTAKPSFGARLSNPLLTATLGVFLLFAAATAGALDAGGRKARPWSLFPALFATSAEARAAHPAVR
jgi:mannuronan synthase